MAKIKAAASRKANVGPPAQERAARSKAVPQAN
jgi:hypothetical protein